MPRSTETPKVIYDRGAPYENLNARHLTFYCVAVPPPQGNHNVTNSTTNSLKIMQFT